MKLLLSFAVGAMLGDIFFHLIPESFNTHFRELNDPIDSIQRKVGLSIIAGLFMFTVVQMALENYMTDSSDAFSEPKSSAKSAGYLNLIANGFDNFTHGLAIGASFLISTKVGLLTTFVIFIHEIPHEICDYAILVNSGFSRWEAVKAQSSVSLFGMLGTATTLYVKSVKTMNARTLWILPFSAGGFLYIALVNLLPEVMDSKSSVQNSLRQVSCVILGIVFMALLALV